MSTMIRISFVLFVASLATGSLHGCEEEDFGSQNVEACESLNAKWAACDPSYAVLPCSSYEGTTCDISDYIACVEASYGECENGSFPNQDLDAFQICAGMATCD